MALTRRQLEVLNVIREFIAKNGYSPSLEEIGSSLGLSSVATVHKHVTHLVEKGLVRRVWNQNRSIEIVESGGDRTGTEVPVAGTVTGGEAVELLASVETVSVPAELVAGRGRTYALRVKGTGMHDEQIREGDLVIVEDRHAPRDDETIVAVVDGVETAVRRFSRDGARVRLQSSDPAVAARVLPADRVQVHGVVVAMIRRY